MGPSEQLAEAIAAAPEQLAGLAAIVLEVAAGGQVRAWYAGSHPHWCVWLVLPGVLRKVEQVGPGHVIDTCLPVGRVSRVVREQLADTLTVLVEVDAETSEVKPTPSGGQVRLPAGWLASEQVGTPAAALLSGLAETLVGEL